MSSYHNAVLLAIMRAPADEAGKSRRGLARWAGLCAPVREAAPIAAARPGHEPFVPAAPSPGGEVETA